MTASEQQRLLIDCYRPVDTARAKRVFLKRGTEFKNGTEFTDYMIIERVKIEYSKYWLHYFTSLNHSVSLLTEASRICQNKNGTRRLTHCTIRHH